MAGRRQRAAFRPAADQTRTSAPSRRQAVAMVLALTVVAAVIAVASFTVKPSKARAFDLFYGSLFVDDNTAPVAVDLASGKPSVRLTNAYTQVAAKASGDLDVVPLTGGTLLLDSTTGEFNMLDSSGFVVKTGSGVPLAKASEPTTSTGIAAGGSAYIVRTGASGTSVYLVSQSTVSSSIGGKPVKPRASAGMDQPAKDVPTTAVSANGALWMLAGAGNARTIRQLSVPAGSNPGVSLDTEDHGTVDGVAAVEAGTVNADGTGGDSVAVASSRAIRVFDAAGASHTEPVKAPPGVDRILPATNEQGGFAFLYHTTSGWSVVHAGVGGSGDARVHPLGRIAGSSSLAVPAQSSGALYTVDLGSGELWTIDRSGDVSPVPDAGKYPIVEGETADFTLTTVIARGARVVYNSRAKLEAMTVFTDGSHKPVVIDKRTAVDLNSNGAAALSDLHRNPAKDSKSTQPPKARPDPAQQVTDQINCKTTTQIPHIPTVQLLDRGSRSVQLQWTYPLLDRQDCAPSTYTVSVQLVSENAPPPPQTVRVQGQTGVNLVGLFPDTQYDVVVTAYLNGKGTPSAPLPVRTSIEGPAAPTDVHATTDDQGNWTVTWNSCGGIQDKCVPAVSWTVIPQLCDDASGLQNAPADGHLVGDPTAHSFTLQYKGNPGLLGRGLSFQVEGIGTKGTAGTASKSSDCAYSWAHPVPDDIRVAASTPPQTGVQGTSSTDVSVSFSGDKDVALGGAGGQLTYQLLSNGSPVTTKGPTTDTSVSLEGIRPGQSYSVRVLVSPPRHSSASVALPAVDVQAAVANWPALSASASFSDGNSSDTGTLTVNIDGLTSAAARGETFDLVNSQLVCGSTAYGLHASDVDPATPLTFPGISRAQYNGGCTARIQLSENAQTVRSPAYFGGTPSRVATSPAVNLPVPELDTSAGQFSASFVNTGILGQPRIAVSYHGNNGLLASYAGGWHIQAQYQDDSGSWVDCGDPSGTNLGQSPATLALPYSCYKRSAQWQATVDFTYFGQSPSPAYAIDVDTSGAPEPVDPSKMSFTASWQGDQVELDYQGDYGQSTLDQLNWQITVTSSGSPGVTCTSTTVAPRVYGGLHMAPDLTACPAVTGATTTGPSRSPGTPSSYTVHVHFSDPNYGTTHDYTVAVGGTPT